MSNLADFPEFFLVVEEGLVTTFFSPPTRLFILIQLKAANNDNSKITFILS